MVQFLPEASNFSFLKNIQTGSGPLPAMYVFSGYPGIIAPGVKGMKLTSYLALVQSFRMSGAIPLLFICALAVCAVCGGANLTLYSINRMLFVM
jgi:hypothetical protein